MRTAFLTITTFHALIHLMGFVKAFGLANVRGLDHTVPKTTGLIWLIVALFFCAYTVLYAFNIKYAWLVGIIAVTVSQTLIIMFWEDAKFGTIPNLIVLAVALVSLGHFKFQNMVEKETGHLLGSPLKIENKRIQEKDITELPDPVKNWLRNSGMMGKPFISRGRVTQKAAMKLKPTQKNWMNASAVQYTTLDQPGFIWSVKAKMNQCLYFQGRDKFENGRAEMLVKINSVFKIVKERGKKLDEGSLQRFLGEMVWYPSLALSPYITWEKINDTLAKASLNYKGAEGSGTFHFDTDGNVVKFSALRFKDNTEVAKRYPWTMDILSYKTFEGIKVPAKMTSTWRLANGDWTWLKLEVTDLQYDKNFSQ